MDNDFILVLGVFIGALTFPALISAFSYGRSPRSALLFFLIGGGLCTFAVFQQPNTYTVDGFPELALSVLADLFR